MRPQNPPCQLGRVFLLQANVVQVAQLGLHLLVLVVRGSICRHNIFDLSDTIAAEVLAIVTTRVRADTRTVFKF